VWDVPARAGGQRSGLARFWLAINRRLLKLAFRYADFFLLSIRPDYEFRYFAVPRDRVLAMKNAIRVHEFQQAAPVASAEKGFNILCTRSTYHSDMGLDTIASAFENLWNSNPGITLTVVGTIPEEVRPQVAALQRNPNVAFFDFLPKDQLKEQIARSGVCVVPFKDVPDLAQTYPIKVLEYMALGKPVIVSRIGGMAELVEDGKTGLHFRAGDPEDLAAKIMVVMREPRRATEIGANARQASLAFDYSVKGKLILDELKMLVAR
jgi:1,4-alpha-glucan branching enzyme